MMLSVGDEALSYLRRRADVSDLSATPQPYQVCRAKTDVAPCLQYQLAKVSSAFVV